MPRIREFDPDVALRSALELFWERGYEATSMSDLVDRLGVARAGIYSAFGSKRELYISALKRYAEDRDSVVMETLGRPGSALRNVRNLLDSYTAAVLTPGQRRGCLVVNSAVEFSARDEAVASIVATSWQVLESALTSALARAREDGELATDKDPQALARLLVVVLQGLQVLGRLEPRPLLVRDALAEVLSTLS